MFYIFSSQNQKRSLFLIFGFRAIISILICSLAFFPSSSYAQYLSVLGLPKNRVPWWI